MSIFSHAKKYQKLIALFFLVLLAVFVVSYKLKQPNFGESIKFQGHYTCLERKIPPPTRECAGGLTNDKKVYEIDNSEYFQANPDNFVDFDNYEVIATGVLQPPGSTYSSDGIIKVTDLQVTDVKVKE